MIVRRRAGGNDGKRLRAPLTKLHRARSPQVLPDKALAFSAGALSSPVLPLRAARSSRERCNGLQRHGAEWCAMD